MSSENKVFIVIASLVIIGAVFLGFKISKTSTETGQADVVTQVQDNIDENTLKTYQIEEETTQSSSAPTAESLNNMFPTVTAIMHTSEGDITLQLTASKTPKTVDNFVTLAKKGFYNNVIFHRVIKGFMIQGGDPTGTGSGGPGYKFDDEPFEGEYTRGTIAMANSGPDTNGSQFFIMHKDTPLKKLYVIFGHVISGIEVVDKIAEAPTVRDPGSSDPTPSTPVNPAKILSIDIK